MKSFATVSGISGQFVAQVQSGAIEMRENLKNYSNREEGSVPWQFDCLRRTAH